MNAGDGRDCYRALVGYRNVPPPNAEAATPFISAVIEPELSSVALMLPMPQLSSSMPSPTAELITAVLSRTILPATLALTVPAPPGYRPRKFLAVRR